MLNIMHQTLFIVFMFVSSFNSGYCTFNTKNNACSNFNYYPVAAISPECIFKPSVLANTTSLIQLNGYPVEEHEITTPDGYILTLYRIPAQNSQINNKPVFIHHGILLSAQVWVAYEKESLAFNLVEKGYDVWLGTYRGTTFSQKHKTLTVEDAAYWDFDFETILTNDFQTEISYISKLTRASGKITCIGYSIGGAFSFLFAAEMPEKAEQMIDGIVALAPVVHVEHSDFALALVRHSDTVFRLFQIFNKYAVQYNEISHTTFVKVCKITPTLCITILNALGENFSKNLDPRNFLVFVGGLDGTSLTLIKHYLQWPKNKRVAKYDYGPKKNLLTYNLTQPPKFDFSRVKVPAYILYGKTDVLGTEKDIKTLYREIGSKKKVMIPIANGRYDFGHLEFCTSRRIRVNLYTKIFEALNEISAVD